MLESITANWPAPHNVKTLITTRIGGHSTNQFSSFNLALHVDDNPLHVLENRKLLLQQLPDKPYWLNQTHSDRVVKLDLIDHSQKSSVALGCSDSELVKTIVKQTDPEDEFNLKTGVMPLEYDASITTQNKKICVVLTADCLPILVTNKAATFVAAIHAGWRGVENGIIENAVKASDSNTQDILVYFGPAICQKHFEVGSEVLEQFTELDPINAKFFTKKSVNAVHAPNFSPTSNTHTLEIMNDHLHGDDKTCLYESDNSKLSYINDKYYCDLIGIARLQLLNLGVFESNMYFSNLCTYCRSDLFYSYRKQNLTGRFASLIWLD